MIGAVEPGRKIVAMTPPRAVLPLGFAAIATASLLAQSPAPAAPPPLPAPAAAAAPSVRRVVVTAATAPAHSCAAATCRVVLDLEKGASLTVLKTDDDWYQVMVRTAENAMTTGWVRAAHVGATASGARDASTPRGAGGNPIIAGPPIEGEDPRGCLTCLATRQPTADEWDAAIADAATKKAPPPARTVTPAVIDDRSADEKMRDAFEARYAPELTRLAGVAAAVDRELDAYLAACFQRFASIRVEGAAPRSTAVDDILEAARATPGAARRALWAGTAGFTWNPSWEPVAPESSAQPSCGRAWEDARSQAERLEVDLELLERDAREHGIYPGVVRDALAARNLSDVPPPTPPRTNVR